MKMKMKENINTKKINPNKSSLPYIREEELLNHNHNTWELFYLLLSKYYENMDAGTEDDFTNSQHTLMAFNILYGEITKGGFLELIKNGYGSYIFESLFSETLKKWGVIEMAAYIHQAKEIYFKHKDELEIARKEEDIFEMYQQYPAFNALDNKFFRIMDSETDKIRQYIEKHFNEFAILA